MGVEPSDLGSGKRSGTVQPRRAIPLSMNDGDAGLVEPAAMLADPAGEPELADLAPPRLGMVDGAMRFLYARGVSARNLVRPFHKPSRLRILATVDEPVPGERAAGMALRAGHFTIAGKRIGTDAADYSSTALGPPVARAIHGFTWLADLEAAGTRDKVAPVGEEILRRWLLVNSEIGEGVAWDVGHTGLRVLNWLIHAPLILSGNDRAFRASVLKHLSRTALWLDRQVGRAHGAREALPAWAAITAAGLLLPDGKPRRLYGEAGLIAALGDAVGEDGGMLSRSPVDQVEAITLLLRLAACYRACRREPPAQLQVMLSLLTPALLSLTHADGSLGSWQGSAPLSADMVTMLAEVADPRARPLHDVQHWGYHRLQARQSVVQIDAAPPPSGRVATGACASTLAFEFSHRDQRIVVNCGGAALAGAAVPRRIEDGLRSSAAHSTLTLADADSTPVEPQGKLGSGVKTVTLDRGSEGGTKVLAASHDGYVGRHGLFHERRLALSADGTVLEGIDGLMPRGRKAKRGAHPYAIRFHLGQGIEIGHQLEGESGRGLALAMPDGSYWQFRTDAGALDVEDSLWVDAGGHPRQIRQLVASGNIEREGGEIGWSFRRMG
ncbi:heparinase II/III family protein [Croceicoccus bisphenolivorans]|uniref:heparinase II/III family protein n=1 Tax=Croceicoccus bisphenolivorans TaxID=1783232 RepID=UPI0008327235|nr:heparinase II/III family protein [Croceicoccus bisphenolivorans]